jgi:hypothetical protein
VTHPLEAIDRILFEGVDERGAGVKVMHPKAQVCNVDDLSESL